MDDRELEMLLDSEGLPTVRLGGREIVDLMPRIKKCPHPWDKIVTEHDLPLYGGDPADYDDVATCTACGAHLLELEVSISRAEWMMTHNWSKP